VDDRPVERWARKAAASPVIDCWLEATGTMKSYDCAGPAKSPKPDASCVAQMTMAWQ